MATIINNLSAADSASLGDKIRFYSQSNGDDRSLSLTALKTLINSGQTAADDKVTQYAAPSATGFSVSITNGSDSVWLVLTPTAGFAAGTIVLPAVANAVDRQEILVNCTQSVATLTVSGNGATVTGAPTSLAANGFFRLRFEAVTKVWFRVG